MPSSVGLHHSFFDLPTVPIFSPGMSPFRASGVVYKGLFDFIGNNIPGGLPRVLSELRSPELVAFLERGFSTTSWYDALPAPYLGHAVARVRGVPYEQQLRDTNTWVENRMGGLYRALLRVASAETVALAIPRATAVIHAFGKATAHAVAPRHVVGVRTGIPRPLVRWIGLSNAIYLELAVARAGALRPRVVFGIPEADSEVSGVPTFRVSFELTWG